LSGIFLDAYLSAAENRVGLERDGTRRRREAVREARFNSVTQDRARGIITNIIAVELDYPRR